MINWLRDCLNRFNRWAEQHPYDPDEPLPNGYRRRDYHRLGITDDEIDFWGPDQPGAPEPEASGWVVWDMLEEMGW